jgi:cytoskeletal protein CcmA (bactofilin family)
LLLREGIKIDGHFIGSITIPEEIENLFVLSDTGCVEGNIHVGRATIAGKIVGRLTAATVVLMPSARIEGEIFYDSLRVADGATINGNVICRADLSEAEKPSADVVQIGQSTPHIQP